MFDDLLQPISDEQPGGELELPADDSEEPSILDSLQTIDEDSEDL